MNFRAKKIRLRFLGLILTAFLIYGASGYAFGQIKIAELKNPNVVEGCGCSFQTVVEAKKRNSQKILFLSESGTNAGWMNINGKDTKLRLVKTTERPNRREKVGDRFYEEYSAIGVKVRLDYIIKKVCPRRDESCEVTNYETRIIVTKGKDSKIIKTFGSCGC